MYTYFLIVVLVMLASQKKLPKHILLYQDSCCCRNFCGNGLFVHKAVLSITEFKQCSILKPVDQSIQNYHAYHIWLYISFKI